MPRPAPAFSGHSRRLKTHRAALNSYFGACPRTMRSYSWNGRRSRMGRLRYGAYKHHAPGIGSSLAPPHTDRAFQPRSCSRPPSDVGTVTARSLRMDVCPTINTLSRNLPQPAVVTRWRGAARPGRARARRTRASSYAVVRATRASAVCSIEIMYLVRRRLPTYVLHIGRVPAPRSSTRRPSRGGTCRVSATQSDLPRTRPPSTDPFFVPPNSVTVKSITSNISPPSVCDASHLPRGLSVRTRRCMPDSWAPILRVSNRAG
ncbi:hypothetical protein HYPSUDRAFT_208774 [Hypholoma sublateritium FD-334 SS-4]|uniref:Uncharacterized protein n=1 Tax=Hypholoma sublateritium (strain FD-334 SS-4) TaxID=945553 RepID=A0A0D2LU07_HYPSF|nr:hypothetical protein HYPSUDRAFT_208774 [Hypholoma sublateritium FD-334 SS-4]